jgi:hypothetical protein
MESLQSGTPQHYDPLSGWLRLLYLGIDCRRQPVPACSSGPMAARAPLWLRPRSELGLGLFTANASKRRKDMNMAARRSRTKVLIDTFVQ